MTQAEIINIINSLKVGLHDSKKSLVRKIKRNNLEGILSMEYGMTKFCIVPTDANFVIKWSTRYETDWASREVTLYEKAEDSGLQMFFPKTEILFISDSGITFVVQEKIDYTLWECECSDKGKRIACFKRIKISNQLCEEMEIPSIWIKSAVALYGEHTVQKLSDFLNKHDINDLYANNVGYKNNKPIIMDFSGYYHKPDF